MEKNFNKILLAILAFSILSIFSAYFIEYVLGHKPCKLCLYQRYPYFVSVFLILNILVLKKYVKLTLLTLALVSFFGSAIAFYHFGIEQGFFNESLICEAQNFENNLSKDELLKIFGQEAHLCCGGSIANSLYIATKLGCKGHHIGVIGNDTIGEKLSLIHI